jgi:hypothetical protein
VTVRLRIRVQEARMRQPPSSHLEVLLVCFHERAVCSEMALKL